MQKKRKRKSRVGAILYAVFLVLWAGALGYGIYFIWTCVWTFGEYWEQSQINPKVDAYMESLSSEIWRDGENGIVKKITEMEHPYQTDEECVEILKEILNEDLRCVPASGEVRENKRIYNLLSGRSKFGQVFVTQYPFRPQENELVNWAIEKYSVYPWEVDGVEFYLDGLYTSFDITVPADYTVLLNGHALSEDCIVERDIHYDVLEAYYPQFDGLPTKVKYHAEQIFGHVDYQLLDGRGQPAQIDPERDDSQFIEPVSEELVARFDRFTVAFTDRYLEFCAGTGEMWYEYGMLQQFVLKDSDLADRMKRMVDSYMGWQHNWGYNFNGCSLNGVTPLGNNIYVLDVSADAGSHMPTGYVTVHRDMLVYIKYFPDQDQVYAFSVEDYNTEESEYIG